MFVLGHLLRSFAWLLHIVFQLAVVLFLLRAVMSWIQPDPRNGFVRFIFQITDPVLDRLRRVIPPIGVVDITSMIVIVICLFLDKFLVPTLQDMAFQFLQ
jgi:YggT family protein